MELIFIKEPLIGALALVIVLLQLGGAVFAKRLSPIVSTALVIVNMVLHAVSLTLIMLCGGGYENALILVLVSCVITLAASPKPLQPSEREVEK